MKITIDGNTSEKLKRAAKALESKIRKPLEDEIIQTAMKHSQELLDENWSSIKEMLDATADGKVSVGLAIAIDWSEAAPKVKTVISYSRRWKDEREDELDDPNQPRLGFQSDLPAAEPAQAEVPEPPAVGDETVAEPSESELAEATPKKRRRSRES